MSLVDLSDLLVRTVSLLAPDAQQSGVEIQLDFPAIYRVWGARYRLEQVVLNLGKNALQAMPQGGKLLCGLQRKEKLSPSQLRIPVPEFPEKS